MPSDSLLVQHCASEQNTPPEFSKCLLPELNAHATMWLRKLATHASKPQCSFIHCDSSFEFVQDVFFLGHISDFDLSLLLPACKCLGARNERLV